MDKIIYTNKDHLLEELDSFVFNKKPDIKLTINSNIKYQKHLGFGGALTDAACISFNYLDEEEQERYLNAYFSKDGLDYNLLRYPLGSCDFSTHNYHYLEDDNLSYLDLDCDIKRIRMYRKILFSQKDLMVFASPWSPPSFMKDNKDMNHGGKLLEQYYDLYANMLLRAVKYLRNEGLNIKVLNIQNEPLATQVWDSCIYSGLEEAKLIKEHIIPNKPKDLSIGIWDHNRDVLIERVNETFSSNLKVEEVDYVCFHWYSGKDFEQLDYIHDKYPSLHLVMTEGCVELLLDKNKEKSIGDFAHAEKYIHQMINDFNHYCEGYIDWNLSLDSQGGPNHVGNFCEAPIMISEDGKMKFNYSYYAIGQFAKFIKPGAYRIDSHIDSEDIEVVAYENPDKSLAIVIYNRSDSTHVLVHPFDNNINIEVLPHTVYTLIHN